MKLYTLLLTALLIGCSQSIDTSVPVSVASEFYDALMKNNIKAARSLIINESNLEDDGTTSFDVKSYKIINTVINNNKAILTTETTYSMGEISFDTVLEENNGVWKVNMPTTMNNMARSAMKKNHIKGKVELSIKEK
jgi:hypothetical protein